MPGQRISTKTVFRPPRPNAIIIALCKLLFPFYSEKICQLRFNFAQSQNDTLKKLKNKRVVILLNHADRHDPMVVVALAKKLQTNIFCMCAREVFDWSHGLLGWLLQRFGVYSVNRAIADLESIKTTKEILKKEKTKLIVFPEAEITGDDVKVHEINGALIHIILDVQTEISLSSNNSASDSVWILPTGVSYSLETSFGESIKPALNKIEKDLHIRNGNESTDMRLARASSQVLENIAARFDCAIQKGVSETEKVNALAQNICLNMAKIINVDLQQKTTTEAMLYALRNEIMNILSSNPNYQETNKYQAFNDNLDHVERLAIFHRILQAQPSAMRVCRIIDFLEMESAGHVSNKGHQKVSIYFGEPIEVANYHSEYKSSKHQAIDKLTQLIAKDIQLALDKSHTI